MSAPTLFVLAADLTKMQVLASLDESDVGRIRPGQLVRFRVDAFPTEEFTGNVTQVRLQPTTIQNVVTYQTVIDVPNPGLKLKPGMTANVNIEIARRADVLRVPNTALRFRPTPEIFAALGQTPPPGGSGGGRGRGAGPETRNAEPNASPVSATDRCSSADAHGAAAAAAGGPGRTTRTAARNTAITVCRAGWRGFRPTGGGRRRCRGRTARPRQFCRAYGYHDARRARTIHGAHAGARLHASRGRTGRGV